MRSYLSIHPFISQGGILSLHPSPYFSEKYFISTPFLFISPPLPLPLRKVFYLYTLPFTFCEEVRPFTFLLLQHTASLIGAVVLAVISQVMTPPEKLPDLFTLLITTYSFVHFAAFLVYFHYLQFTA